MNRPNRIIFPAILAIAVLVNIPAMVSGNCTSGKNEEGQNHKEALVYKLVGIATISVAGATGVSLPFAGKIFPVLSPEKDYFFIVKAFAAGVILATGFIHVLPHAFGSLTSPCLSQNPWGSFPFAGLVAMAAVIGAFVFESSATAYQKRRVLSVDGDGVPGNSDMEKPSGDVDHLQVHARATHGHDHASVLLPETDPGSNPGTAESLRYSIIAKVLELGIIVHSVVVGLSLGASESPATIKPLVAALTFHQFFEGMSLGGCLSQAKFKTLPGTIMAAFFVLTTPFGIVLGIVIAKAYDENSPSALIVEGMLNSVSAGILIYMALVDFLSAGFMNPRMQANRKLHLGSNASLLLGAGGVTLMAKWA